MGQCMLFSCVLLCYYVLVVLLCFSCVYSFDMRIFLKEANWCDGRSYHSSRTIYPSICFFMLKPFIVITYMYPEVKYIQKQFMSTTFLHIPHHITLKISQHYFKNLWTFLYIVQPNRT